MADQKAPELPEGWHWDEEGQSFVRMFGKKTGFCVTMGMLRALLSAHGLHICSEADRKVLEACADLEGPAVTSGAHLIFWPAMAKVCEAELARRSGT
jgi:hypothetical protein